MYSDDCLKSAKRYLLPSQCFISHICFTDTNQQNSDGLVVSFSIIGFGYLHAKFRIDYLRGYRFIFLSSACFSWRPPWGSRRTTSTVIWSLGWQTVAASLKPVYIKLSFYFFGWKRNFRLKKSRERPCAVQWISFDGGGGKHVWTFYSGSLGRGNEEALSRTGFRRGILYLLSGVVPPVFELQNVLEARTPRGKGAVISSVRGRFQSQKNV